MALDLEFSALLADVGDIIAGVVSQCLELKPRPFIPVPTQALMPSPRQFSDYPVIHSASLLPASAGLFLCLNFRSIPNIDLGAIDMRHARYNEFPGQYDCRPCKQRQRGQYEDCRDEADHRCNPKNFLILEITDRGSFLNLSGYLNLRSSKKL